MFFSFETSRSMLLQITPHRRKYFWNYINSELWAVEVNLHCSILANVQLTKDIVYAISVPTFDHVWFIMLSIIIIKRLVYLCLEFDCCWALSKLGASTLVNGGPQTSAWARSAAKLMTHRIMGIVYSWTPLLKWLTFRLTSMCKETILLAVERFTRRMQPVDRVTHTLTNVSCNAWTLSRWQSGNLGAIMKHRSQLRLAHFPQRRATMSTNRRDSKEEETV